MFQSGWKDEELREVLLCADRYGTPLYYLDADRLQREICRLRAYLPEKVKLCFSVKSNPWFVKAALREADYLETCSPGEVQLCLELGIPACRISAGGVCKREEECHFLAEMKPRRISVESPSQLRALSNAAQRVNGSLPVLLRLSSGNQFGMPLETLQDILKNEHEYPGIEFAGVHFYSGTQKRRAGEVRRDVEQLLNAVRLIDVREVEYGPGIGAPLFQEQRADEFLDCLKTLREGLTGLSAGHEVILECGRLLTAGAGVFATQIVDMKENAGRTYWIVDGGMHHLSYYGQVNGKPHPVIWQAVGPAAERKTVTVCGSLCAAGDILAKDVSLGPAVPGSCLLFLNSGAYAVTEGRSLFLSRALPAVLCREDGETQLLRGHAPTFPLNMPDHN